MTSLCGVTESTGKHLETETKYDAPADLALPDFSGLNGSTAPPERHRYFLTATYFDTDDLDLLQNKITLRRRVGGPDEGWHLKRPVREDTRLEDRAPLGDGEPGTVPKALASLVADVIGGRPLHPVAILDTERTVTILTGQAGEPVAEIADDLVTASRLDQPGAEPVRWREIEVEAAEGSAEAPRVLAAVGQVLHHAGAIRSPSGSKLGRLLGG
jgi:hypothetical protein